jgi:hypothetical protein
MHPAVRLVGFDWVSSMAERGAGACAGGGFGEAEQKSRASGHEIGLQSRGKMLTICPRRAG